MANDQIFDQLKGLAKELFMEELCFLRGGPSRGDEPDSIASLSIDNQNYIAIQESERPPPIFFSRMGVVVVIDHRPAEYPANVGKIEAVLAKDPFALAFIPNECHGGPPQSREPNRPLPASLAGNPRACAVASARLHCITLGPL